jgi:Bacterial regulatory helix-turn-helix protein, lysR family
LDPPGSASAQVTLPAIAAEDRARPRHGLRSQKKTNDSAMDIRALTSFVAVAENLSFARAAESLNTVQSAVSQRIKLLEQEVGSNCWIARDIM